jgi:hypothetical protein
MFTPSITRLPRPRRLAPALFAAAMLVSAQTTIKTGPAAGEKIPAFEAIDQNGNKQTLASIAGPKGAMLVFYRSADW